MGCCFSKTEYSILDIPHPDDRSIILGLRFRNRPFATDKEKIRRISNWVEMAIRQKDLPCKWKSLSAMNLRQLQQYNLAHHTHTSMKMKTDLNVDGQNSFLSCKKCADLQEFLAMWDRKRQKILRNHDSGIIKALDLPYIRICSAPLKRNHKNPRYARPIEAFLNDENTTKTDTREKHTMTIISTSKGDATTSQSGSVITSAVTSPKHLSYWLNNFPGSGCLDENSSRTKVQNVEIKHTLSKTELQYEQQAINTNMQCNVHNDTSGDQNITKHSADMACDNDSEEICESNSKLKVENEDFAASRNSSQIQKTVKTKISAIRQRQTGETSELCSVELPENNRSKKKTSPKVRHILVTPIKYSSSDESQGMQAHGTKGAHFQETKHNNWLQDLAVIKRGRMQSMAKPVITTSNHKERNEESDSSSKEKLGKSWIISASEKGSSSLTSEFAHRSSRTTPGKRELKKIKAISKMFLKAPKKHQPEFVSSETMVKSNISLGSCLSVSEVSTVEESRELAQQSFVIPIASTTPLQNLVRHPSNELQVLRSKAALHNDKVNCSNSNDKAVVKNSEICLLATQEKSIYKLHRFFRLKKKSSPLHRERIAEDIINSRNFSNNILGWSPPIRDLRLRQSLGTLPQLNPLLSYFHRPSL